MTKGAFMLPIERQNAIVELVNKDGSVRVKDLAARFEVTEDCIRKDLTQLEHKSLLKKSRGGAVPARLVANERFVAERKDKHLKAKQSKQLPSVPLNLSVMAILSFLISRLLISSLQTCLLSLASR